PRVFSASSATASTVIYTLSLHDALPIYAADRGSVPYSGGNRRVAHTIGRTKGRQGTQSQGGVLHLSHAEPVSGIVDGPGPTHRADRKSTRLNSSHQIISYAVFCLKKKKK